MQADRRHESYAPCQIPSRGWADILRRAWKDIRVRSFPRVEVPATSAISSAHQAGLILTGSHVNQDNEATLNLGEMTLAAGRPVLVAGTTTTEIKADTIVVGWKESRAKWPQ